MFYIDVNKNETELTVKETMTSGSINAYAVKFNFSDDWDSLSKIATFRAADKTVSVILDDTNTCTIPWEVLTTANTELYVGVVGAAGTETPDDMSDDVVLPTIWTLLGMIRKGANSGEEPLPPSPDVYEQILIEIASLKNTKQNKLTAGDNITITDDNVISATASDPYDDTEIRNELSALSDTVANKQDKLTAGDNITITDDTISASSYDDTAIKNELNAHDALIHEYGAAINANTNAIGVLNDVMPTKQNKLTAGDNITITDNSVISANVADPYDDTEIRSELSALSDTVANKQNKLTAGDNITITDDTISASSYDDTAVKADIAALSDTVNTKQGKLTAGDNITITDDNVISATGGGESYDDTEIRGEISALSDTVTTKQDKLIAGDNITIAEDNTISASGYDDTAIRADVDANTAAIAVLNGDGEGSVKKAVSAGIAEVVAGAPEDLDTLKEIDDWISSHSESAAAMNSQIQTNTADITSLKADKQDKLTAGDNITIAEDNTISAVAYDDTAVKADIAENTADIADNAANIAALDADKQDKLTAGDNITIAEDNTISASAYDDTVVKADISALHTATITNTVQLETNTAAIAENTAEIAENYKSIAANSQAISKNTADITRKQDKLTGTENQVVGFNADGVAVPVERPTDGKDGNTPFIGINGNWWIGETDTGIAAQGPVGPAGANGATPEIHLDNHWYVAGVDTGVNATGPTGPVGPVGPAGSYTAGTGIIISNDVISLDPEYVRSSKKKVIIKSSDNSIRITNSEQEMEVYMKPAYANLAAGCILLPKFNIEMVSSETGSKSFQLKFYVEFDNSRVYSGMKQVNLSFTAGVPYTYQYSSGYLDVGSTFYPSFPPVLSGQCSSVRLSIKHSLSSTPSNTVMYNATYNMSEDGLVIYNTSFPEITLATNSDIYSGVTAVLSECTISLPFDDFEFVSSSTGRYHLQPSYTNGNANIKPDLFNNTISMTDMDKESIQTKATVTYTKTSQSGIISYYTIKAKLNVISIVIKF